MQINFDIMMFICKVSRGIRMSLTTEEGNVCKLHYFYTFQCIQRVGPRSGPRGTYDKAVLKHAVNGDHLEL